MDAAGAGVLARARRTLGSAFTIVAPQRGIVRRVLDVTGLSRFE
jgi:anti-anti-sigma regulatory factor